MNLDTLSVSTVAVARGASLDCGRQAHTMAAGYSAKNSIDETSCVSESVAFRNTSLGAYFVDVICLKKYVQSSHER